MGAATILAVDEADFELLQLRLFTDYLLRGGGAAQLS
jgi:hypothetical protein